MGYILYGYGLYSDGLYSYGLYSYGLYSYGLKSYGKNRTRRRRVGRFRLVAAVGATAWLDAQLMTHRWKRVNSYIILWPYVNMALYSYGPI